MQGIFQFIASSMLGGVVGNATYDSLKKILGISFNKLSDFLSDGQHDEFKRELEILFKTNKELEQKILDLEKKEHYIENNVKGDMYGSGNYIESGGTMNNNNTFNFGDQKKS